MERHSLKWMLEESSSDRQSLPLRIESRVTHHASHITEVRKHQIHTMHAQVLMRHKRV
jgi:hypothetical protein